MAQVRLSFWRLDERAAPPGVPPLLRRTSDPFLVEEKFAFRINVILPVQSSAQKYFALPVGQIISTSPRHPASIRGAFRDRHERWVRDAVDALARRTNATKADGEVVWS